MTDFEPPPTEAAVAGEETERSADEATGATETWADRPDTETRVDPAAAPAASPGAPLGRGRGIGRFVVLSVLGTGGMGRVYAAYDPQLDRRVALKLLRSRRGDDQQRLLREAKALARLDHPNVVTVHEVGMQDGRLFLVMEYVPGSNLSRWQREQSPSAEQILEVFLQAGRGLAAAHGAGIVHRDFKAGNVMLRPDGRVQVVDFGIARADAEAMVIDAASLDLGAGPAPPASLAATAGVAGTPGMMSPEQKLGKAVGPASDQYSFCVALERALAAAPGGEITPRLEALLDRGRRPEPGERFASMHELLRELERDPRRARQRMIGSAAAVALVALATWMASQQAAPPLCRGGADRFAEVWNPPRSAAMASAFDRLPAAWSADLWQSTRRGLDDYRQRWIDQYTAACEATQVHGEQSADLLDRRMDCLNQRLLEVDALADLLIKGADAARSKAVEAVGALVPVKACADRRTLSRLERPELEPAIRAVSERLREQLARAKALELAGEADEGQRLVAAVIDEAREHELWAVAAEALLRQGLLLELGGDGEAAAAMLGRALGAAQAARHDRVAAEALVRSVRIAAYLQADLEQGQDFAAMARAVLARSDHMGDLSAVLEDQAGALAFQQGRYDRALFHHRRALAAKQQAVGPNHVSLATTLIRLANVLLEQEAFDAAREVLQRALLLREQAYGLEHPKVGAVLDRLGTLAFLEGDYDTSFDRHRRALAIARGAHGDGHLSVGNGQMHVGAVLIALGRYDAALEASGVALAIYQERLGSGHPHVALALSNLGTAYHELGENDRAVEAYREALEIQQATYGGDHPWVARTVFNLAEVASARRAPDRALPLYQRALRIWQRAHGAEHELVAIGQSGLAKALVEVHRPAEAVPLLETALARLSAEAGDPLPLAEARFTLARALDALGQDRERVLALVEQARAAIEGEGGHPRLQARIEAWWSSRH